MMTGNSTVKYAISAFCGAASGKAAARVVSLFMLFVLLAGPASRNTAAAQTAGAGTPQFTALSIDEMAKLPDSTDAGCRYFKISSKIHFKLSSTEFDSLYLDNNVRLEAICSRIAQASGMEIVSVKVNGTASPDGSYSYNSQLARKRAARLKTYLEESYPAMFADSMEWDVAYQPEDWSYVEELLEASNIEHCDEALEIIRDTCGLDGATSAQIVGDRKSRLRGLYDCTVWNQMLESIFPLSRGAELIVIVKAPVAIPAAAEPYLAVSAPAIDKVGGVPQYRHVEQNACQQVMPACECSQPVLAVKTNMLFYAAYVPNYGFAPIPNIAIDYLPHNARWSAGASLDIPWYRNYANHKFMQIRNWQLEGRYYFGSSYDLHEGWYASGYIHTGVFGIGFNKKQGWEGESVGAGFGGGYVMPISVDHRWKLEFGLQLGYMNTQYDPYVYGHPTNGEEDGLYYYKWKYDPDLFQKRQYRHSWLGPTRIAVTLRYDFLTYDCLYRSYEKSVKWFESLKSR